MADLENATTCASKFVYDKIKTRDDLNVPVKHDDEADTLEDGIIIKVMSPGVDGGDTDGYHDLGNPLILVMSVAPSLQAAADRNTKVHQSLKDSSGSNDYGKVVRVSREGPFHKTKPTASKTTRYYVGGFYRVIVTR